MNVIAEDCMWFEVKAVYPKMQESGEIKMSKDVFAVSAETFGDAEKMTLNELGQYIPEGSDDGANVVAVAIAPYSCLLSDGGKEAQENYFRAKVKVLFVDEKGKEKYNNAVFLVNAYGLDEARDIMTAYMENSMDDYKIASLVETPIIDIIRG